jgi:hypothetical protein
LLAQRLESRLTQGNQPGGQFGVVFSEVLNEEGLQREEEPCPRQQWAASRRHQGELVVAQAVPLAGLTLLAEVGVEDVHLLMAESPESLGKVGEGACQGADQQVAKGIRAIAIEVESLAGIADGLVLSRGKAKVAHRCLAVRNKVPFTQHCEAGFDVIARRGKRHNPAKSGFWNELFTTREKPERGVAKLAKARLTVVSSLNILFMSEAS